MANESLTLRQDDLVPYIEQNGLTDLIKPLIREIDLFDSYIAGTTHLKDPSVLAELQIGDRLTLQREKNKFDDNAIRLLDPKGRKLGYVPEKDNIVFARLLDAGKILAAKVKHIEKKGSFTKIEIGILLVDV